MSTFRNPNREPDIEVELTLKASNDGGRKGPLPQECRLPHDFGLEDELNDGMYRFPDGPPAPGESARALVWLLVPERNQHRFYPGFGFEVWEGRIIGSGRILKVINPALRKEPS